MADTRTVTVNFAEGPPQVYQNVPKDVTPDMIEARASGANPGRKIVDISGQLSSMAENQGGAVTGVATPPQARQQIAGGAVDIGGAGAMAGAMGAMAPEILSGIAGVAGSFPATAGAAPAINAAASAARAAGRPVMALSGAVAGLASESLGKTAEAMGAPPGVAEGARFVGGALTPEALPAANWVLQKYLITPSLSIFSKFRKEAIRELASRLQGRPQDISQKEADLLNTLTDNLRGGPASEASQRGIYDILQTGARNKLALGEREAQVVLDNTRKQISSDLNDAMNGPVAYASNAADRISNRGRDALATAQMQRFNIGNDIPSSDIGNGLRQVVVAKNSAAIDARKMQYKADEAARDAIVTHKQDAGKFVNQTPEYQSLVDDLKSNLTPGKRSPDVQKTYSNILSQIQNPEKDVFGQNKPIDFQVLDDVRRKLGEVFSGNPPEGYAAISAADARKYYQQISGIQKAYAGEPQANLLEHYASTTEGLQQFSSKAGKKLTALDKFDESKFATDPAALPKQFFGTKQGVSDLLELSGNRPAVVQAGLDLATSELNGKSASQVRNWMTDRREMLAVLPEVRDKVVQYAQSLEHGEQTARAAENGVGRLQKYASDQRTAAERAASQAETAGQQRSADILKSRGQEAISLLGPKGEMFPVQNVRALIESGTTKQWEHAAPLINASPGGAQMLEDAIKQTLATKALKSTNDLTAFFDNNIRPAVTATKLMTDTAAENIAAQLRAIENMKVPDPEKLGIGRRIILQGLAGYSASGAARGGTSLVNMIPPQMEQK